MNAGPEDKSVRRARQAIEGEAAMKDYRARAEKLARNTERLRAERLAREAQALLNPVIEPAKSAKPAKFAAAKTARSAGAKSDGAKPSKPVDVRSKKKAAKKA